MTGALPIVLVNVVVERGKQRLAGPISATVSGGGATLIVGPNGAGKTTLLRLLHGLEQASAMVKEMLDS